MTNIEKDSAQPQYWVVGAMLGGHAEADMYETFVERGYWDYGYPDHAQYDKGHPGDAGRRNQIQAGDRIAIKKMLGQGAKEIRIRAIGIVKDNDTTLRRKHLEGDYLSRAVVQDFVVQLAAEFRQKILELPPRLRRIIPGPPNFKLEDDFEKIIDTFLRELAETAVIVPEPERPKGAYTTKPGPRPKRFNNGAPPKALEAAE